jgi:hypothetical protein
MSKSSEISCPNCGHKFELENQLRLNIEQEFKEKYNSRWKGERNTLLKEKDEINKREQLLIHNQEQLHNKVQDEVNKKLFAEKEELSKLKAQANDLIDSEVKKQRTILFAEAQKKAEDESKLKVEMLEKELGEKREAMQESNKRELELLKKQQEFEEQKQSFELETQRNLQQIQNELEEKIKKDIGEKTDLKMKEKEMQIESLKKNIEEMDRRINQGSMQTQGEVQEIALEELLKTSFPYDIIGEVGKGVRGADAIQLVNNHFGKNCGKIIYESKRTKNFTADWIDKLKEDQRNAQADVAILVTATMPKDMKQFGERSGVWICSFDEVRALATVIRDGIIKISTAMASQENKGEKMQMMYEFLIGNEFKSQMEAIVEGFTSLRNGITKERVQAEKNWKEREKTLERILLNTSHFIGSVKGIAGNAMDDIKMIEEE